MACAIARKSHDGATPSPARAVAPHSTLPVLAPTPRYANPEKLLTTQRRARRYCRQKDIHSSSPQTYCKSPCCWQFPKQKACHGKRLRHFNSHPGRAHTVTLAQSPGEKLLYLELESVPHTCRYFYVPTDVACTKHQFNSKLLPASSATSLQTRHKHLSFKAAHTRHFVPIAALAQRLLAKRPCGKFKQSANDLFPLQERLHGGAKSRH